MKTMKQIIMCFFILIATIPSVKAQVKIGNNPNSINANSILELETTDKGFLPPRVALTSISSVSPLTAPVPSGMIVYSSGGAISDGAYIWDGSKWINFSLEKTSRNNFVLVKSASDFPAAVGGIINLVTGTTYEINGTITITDKINLNGCLIKGVDAVNDKLIYTGTEELFTGSNTGNIERVSLTAATAKIFNINAGGTYKNLLVQNCYFVGCNTVGTIQGVGGTVFFANVAYFYNTNGIIFQNDNNVVLNNALWDISNYNTYEKFIGTFNIIQILGGDRLVSSLNTATAINITGITSVVAASIKVVMFTGNGTYVAGNFSNSWEVEASGLNTEKDDVAAGNLYLSSTTTTTFTAANTPKKLSGTTVSTNLRRVISATNNRLTYTGAKTKSFLVICSLTGSPAANNTIYSFYVAKNGVILPESRQNVKMATTTDQQSIAISCTVTLAPNDYIEIWAENTTGTGYIVVSSLNMAMK